MSAPRSAGLLLYRIRPDAGVEVWIAHMGGPYWANKDDGAWSIPKGLVEPDDADDLQAAMREFEEEIGTPAPAADYVRLGEFRQASGKVVVAFAGRAEFDPTRVESNTFELEWPPRSGQMRTYPEIDDARWLSLDRARTKVVRGQVAILDALAAILSNPQR